MNPERYEAIKQHIEYAENGDPIKDYENEEDLIYELWDEIQRLRKGLTVHKHTEECFRYAGMTAARHGNYYCLAKCTDSRRALTGEKEQWNP